MRSVVDARAAGSTLRAAMFVLACAVVVEARQTSTAPVGHLGQPDEAAGGTSQAPPAVATIAPTDPAGPSDYRVGPYDVLSVAVLQAPELNSAARVSARGEISLPLIGLVRAAGLTPQELALTIEQRLREKYIRDPDVTVQLTELQSQPVSVMGAVQHPGVFQLRGRQTLLEVLSLAGGLADDAGDTVTILCRGEDGVPAGGTVAAAIAPGPGAEPAARAVKLRALLESPGSGLNVPIHSGDVVTVRSAPVVYVVGAVNKPGSFAMRGHERMTVLQAVALGEGVTGTAARGDAVLLRTDAGGERVEIPVDLNAILKGQDPDLALEAQDVLFVPNSGTKVAVRATVDTLLRVLSFRVFP